MELLSYDCGYEDMAEKAYVRVTETRDYVQRILNEAAEIEAQPDVHLDFRNAEALGYLKSGIKDILRSLNRIAEWLEKQGGLGEDDERLEKR